MLIIVIFFFFIFFIFIFIIIFIFFIVILIFIIVILKWILNTFFSEKWIIIFLFLLFLLHLFFWIWFFLRFFFFRLFSIIFCISYLMNVTTRIAPIFFTKMIIRAYLPWLIAFSNLTNVTKTLSALTTTNLIAGFIRTKMLFRADLSILEYAECFDHHFAKFSFWSLWLILICCEKIRLNQLTLRLIWIWLAKRIKWVLANHIC